MNKVRLPEYTVEKTVSVMSETIDWGLAQNDVPNSWGITMGEGITVYVLDTGAPKHIDLKESFLFGENFSSSSSIYDTLGHSSHCCGIIAADKNGIGVVGIAPKANVVTVKCLGDDGTGGENEVCKALEFCTKARLGIEKVPKPDIISMSLGSPDKMRNAYKFISQLTKLNVPIVCAVGNESSEVCYPAAYKETISVGAYDKRGKTAGFNNFGDEVDFVAPGVDIYSTYLNNRYAKLSGSSMATPFVSGIIALMLSKHKKQEQETGLNDCRTVAQIKEHLVKHSVDIGEKGKDKKSGFGIINICDLISNS